jgi:hypothetical protein
MIDNCMSKTDWDSYFICFFSFVLLFIFGCFTGILQVWDVRTDCKTPVRDPGQSGRSQGTTTNSGGDVCGGVKWAAL